MLLGVPSHPAPGIDRGKVPVPRRLLFQLEIPEKPATTEEWLKGNAAYLSAKTKPAGEA